ncbi:MAG: protein-L-isoaspartate O-methyltransferase family protein [Neisseriaceae bacterium]
MDIEKARYNMVEQQIRTCNVLDKSLLEVLINVKREAFVAPLYKNIAFSDTEIPLPGSGKMLCPKIDAMLLQELHLNRNDKVLEIGTGSGYITAILAKLSKHVYSVEINEENKQFAIKNLTYAGINNVSIVGGNGLSGFSEHALYDKIFIGGAGYNIPEELKEQLTVGGVLVGIVGKEPAMKAVKITRIGENNFKEEQLFETVAEYLIEGNNFNKFIF